MKELLTCTSDLLVPIAKRPPLSLLHSHCLTLGLTQSNGWESLAPKTAPPSVSTEWVDPEGYM